MVGSALIGRESELRQLHDLVDGLPARGSALVLRGDAGVGKSALLVAATAHVRALGYRLLRTSGVESEAHLPFAGLHQLLQPVLGNSAALPAPQRAALEVAFGISPGPPPTTFLIGLATLELLAEAAAERPVVVIVEDVHVLDDATCEVLPFVARRLAVEPIAMLFAARNDSQNLAPYAGLPDLLVECLSPAAAAELLDSCAPALEPSLRTRLLEQAAGNPLAITELPKSLEAVRAGDSSLLPTLLPLTMRLEQTFTARASQLPPATQLLLLVAAANDGDRIGETVEAALVLDPGLQVTALDPAENTGLIEVDGEHLRFRHPLMRSAMYQGAGLARRTEVHAALASALAAEPERRTWHRAASCIEPNEEVASELASMAEQAVQSGAVATAIQTLERAAQLSTDDDARVKRMLVMAELLIQTGRLEEFERLERKIRVSLAPDQRLALDALRALADDSDSGNPDRVRPLVRLAESVARDGMTDLALNFLWAAASRANWSIPDDDVISDLIQVADRTGSPFDDPRMLAVRGFSDPLRNGAAVVDHLSKHGLDPNLDAWKARLVCMSAAAVGATDISGALFPNVIESLRSEGRLGGLLRALVVRSFGAAHDGDLITAYAMAGEAGRVAEDNGEVLWRALGRVAHALVHAMRGEVDAAERTFARAEHFVITSTIRPQVANLHIARGIQAFAAGRLDDAYGHLRTVVDPGEPTHARIEPFFALSYFADVAAQLGRHTEARELVAAKRRAAHTTTAIPIHNQILYAEIRLDDSPDFESRARMVLANEFGRQPFLRARLELALGSWLRRERRPTEARSMLRSARDTLDTLGVRPWAERARQELRATGETSPSRPATGLDYLTPQELQIAEMAARGLSNREIGQRLFLSHRTVGSHLYRIFPKLEVTNRAQLADALDRQQVALQQTS